MRGTVTNCNGSLRVPTTIFALPSFSLQRLIPFFFLYLTVSSCYLNSCPYLRTPRTDKCGMCGKNESGVCVTDGVCCTADECKEDDTCKNVDQCPLPYCEISGGTGFCASSTLCCSEKFCQRTMQCLNSMTKKIKRMRFRR